MAEERSGVPSARPVTKWSERDVPGMWQAIENQTGDDHWRLVLGWRRTYELTATHLQRLTEYRTKLAEAWPPDRNAAAAAYLARLDFLTRNMQATLEVAAANYTTFATTVGALVTARQALKPIYDEYVGTAQAIQEHEDRVAFNAASEGPTTIGPAPVGRQDLERLNNRARAIMYDLSHTLTEAQSALKHPPSYAPRTRFDPGNPDVYGSSQTVPGAGNKVASNVTGGGSGLNIGASVIESQSPPLDSTTASNRVPYGSPPVISSDAKAPPFRRVPTPSQHARDMKPNLSIRGTSGGRPNLFPPDGVIGVAAGHDRQAVIREPNRVNPIGGVIGGPALTQGSSAHPQQQVGKPPLYGMIGGPSTQQRREEQVDRRRGDPDNPWEVIQGTPPIITPPPEAHRFDPGPAIGLDR